MKSLISPSLADSPATSAKSVAGFRGNLITWVFGAAVGLLATIRLAVAVTFGHLWIDEMTRAGVVVSILAGDFPLSENHFGPWFVFVDLDFTSITLFGPATLWAAVFGTSVASFRVFAALATITAILLLSRAASYWFASNAKVFLATALVGLALPWNFLQGMLFWDATFAPIYISIAFWAFSYLFCEVNRNKYLRVFAQVILPLVLIAAAYTYRPIAFAAVGLYVVFGYYLCRSGVYRRREVIFTLALSVVAAFPLALAMFTWPWFTERSEFIAVWSVPNLPLRGRIESPIWNFERLISFSNLFLAGDGNRRHSTGAIGGMLGLGAIVPFFSYLWFSVKGRLNENERLLSKIAAFGLFFSLLGATLTTREDPHSLRSNGAWVFFTIFIFLGFRALYQNRTRRRCQLFFRIAVALFIAGTLFYIVHFLLRYMPTREMWFPQQFEIPALNEHAYLLRWLGLD